MKRVFPLDPSSPAQLALWSICGSLLSDAAFLVLFFFRSSPLESPTKLSSFACGIAGIVLSLRAHSLLKKGIANGAWADEQLAPLRAKANRPLWTHLNTALFFASAGFMIFGGHAHRGLAFPFMFPAQAIGQLLRTLSSPRPLGSGCSASTPN
jgi:hypothetical protein